MVNRSRTQAKDLLAKRNKSKKTVSHLLVCGLVLSSSMIPVASVFAEDNTQSSVQTASQDSNNQQANTEQATQEAVPTVATEDTLNAKTDATADATGATDAQTDENGMTQEEATQITDAQKAQMTEVSSEGNWKLIDGFYYRDGNTSNEGVMDITVNYVDQATGATVGSETSDKSSISNAVFGLSSAGISTEKYGILSGSDSLVTSDEIYLNGNPTGLFETVSFTVDNFINTSDFTSKWADGHAVLNVPVTAQKDVTPEQPQEEVSFKVNYVDEKGQAIVAPSTQTGNVGEEYWVTADGLTGYKLKDGEPTEYRGTFQKGMGDLTFNYVKEDDTPDPSQQGTINVNYVDIDTGAEISPATTVTGVLGSSDTLKEQKINGYTFVPEQNEYGVDTRVVNFQSYEQTVTLKYKAVAEPQPVEQGSVTIKYVDNATGNEIKESEVKKGDVGTEFSVDSASIMGYSFDKDKSDKTTGTYTKDAQTVTLRYNKDSKPVEQGSVTVKYVDAKTNDEIHKGTTLKGNVGTDFSVDVPTVDGYTYNKDQSDKTTGTYTKDAQTVTVKYDKDTTPDPQPEDSKYRGELETTIKEAKPFVNKTKYQASYVDKLDEAIKSGEKALSDNPAPTKQSKQAKNADLDALFQANIKSINTALADVKANPVKEDPKPVVKSGGVQIYYLDAIGQPIKGDTTEASGNVGDSYNISESKIPSEITFNGIKYTRNASHYNDSVKPALKGTLEKDAKVIYVVYDSKAITPSDKVSMDINYLDQNGDSIKKAIKVNGKTGDKYDLTQYAVNIDGYKLMQNKLPKMTGTFGMDNSQVSFYYQAVSEPNGDSNNNGNNDNGSNSNNGSNNSTNNNSGNGSTNNNSGNGSTNSNNNSNNSSTSNNSDTDASTNKNIQNSSDTIKPVSTKTNTDTSSDKKDMLPQTGESTNPWLSVSGFIALASTTFALFFKRKRL